MATSREEEILRLIRQNPLISQQELASTCGITRSSVGVHISNLMKKGIIEGKGYLVNQGPYIAVVGGAVLDIWGASLEPVILQDSNPGTVLTSAGGVGRNIANNLALLGEDVKFITVFGDDDSSKILRDSCHNVGINISHSSIVPGGISSAYLYITGPKGEMEVAVCGAGLSHSISPDFVQKRLPVINGAALCVADTNLPVETLTLLAHNCTVPLFVDTVSSTKAAKIVDLLPYIHTIKPNRIEAELLSGVSITDDASLGKAADVLLGKGLQQVFISLEASGVYAANKHEHFRLPVYKGDIVNSTGAGDSFLSALAFAKRHDYSLKKSAQAGLATASIALQGEAAVNPALSARRILSIMESTEKEIIAHG